MHWGPKIIKKPSIASFLEHNRASKSLITGRDATSLEKKTASGHCLQANWAKLDLLLPFISHSTWKLYGKIGKKTFSFSSQKMYIHTYFGFPSCKYEYGFFIRPHFIGSVSWVNGMNFQYHLPRVIQDLLRVQLLPIGKLKIHPFLR